MKSIRWLATALLGVLAVTLFPAGFLLAQTVEVTVADPSTALQGTLGLDVAVTGSGFDATARVSFLVTGTTNQGGITVRNVSVRGSKKLVATIDVADTAIVDKFDIVVTLDSGRKGKGTTLFTIQPKTNDPCATAIGFPAFVFVKTTSAVGLYAADATGKCQRLVLRDLTTDFTRFAYPVVDDMGLPTNRGRIVWRGKDPASTAVARNTVYALDFTVSGTTVTPGALHLIHDFGAITNSTTGDTCCGIDLSADGREVYVTAPAQLRPEGYVRPVVRMRLPADASELDSLPSPDRITVYESQPKLADFSELTADLAVNGSNTLLYVSHLDGTTPGRAWIVRVDLDPDLVDTGSATESVTIFERNPTTKWIGVGADTSSAASDLIGLAPYDSSISCPVLVTMNGRTATTLNEGTRWPASGLTWAANQLLSAGYDRRCRLNDTIVEIDPLTGATVTLLSGRYADGR